MSIDVVSGGRGLILTIGCTTAANLNRYLISQLGEMSGVRSVRTNPVVTTIAGAVQWRVNALLEEQVAAIEDAQRVADRQMEDRASMSDSDYRAVIEILCHDGRATSTLIGKRLGIPQRRAREYLHSTLMSGLIELRTDVLSQESGWPVSAWYFLRVPAAKLREVGARLRTLRTVRAILSVAGPANVLVLVWLPSINEVEGLEIAMEQALPSVRIVDRSLVLAVRKRVGRTFGDDELPRELVPWELAQSDQTIDS
ncbi:hypothetical protein I1A62_22460 [Rhodococcus sp. USK10]|uniref:Lrp/AsnC family transcriptional regulator n=1 Tax=Rhodococcus sp. USK10 TaxID=2789739 RepID=UPI001C602467|nr:hypothetical protein [Rhodococcus sp. USK10]QYB07044.1 hypothetical protein I1A62_22460 [Rhodococcus sp. USK10]